MAKYAIRCLGFYVVHLHFFPLGFMCFDKSFVNSMELIDVVLLHIVKMQGEGNMKRVVYHIPSFCHRRLSDISLFNVFYFHQLLTGFHHTLHIVFWIFQPKKHLVNKDWFYGCRLNFVGKNHSGSQ